MLSLHTALGKVYSLYGLWLTHWTWQSLLTGLCLALDLDTNLPPCSARLIVRTKLRCIVRDCLAGSSRRFHFAEYTLTSTEWHYPPKISSTKSSDCTKYGNYFFPLKNSPCPLNCSIVMYNSLVTIIGSIVKQKLIILIQR